MVSYREYSAVNDDAGSGILRTSATSPSRTFMPGSPLPGNAGIIR